MSFWKRLLKGSPPPAPPAGGQRQASGPRFPEPPPSERLALLSRSRPFQRLPPEVVEIAALRMAERRFEKGELILRQGEPGDALHIIAEGVAEVSVHIGSGKTHVLGRLAPGDIAGEMALLTHEPRTADVRALSNVRTLALEARVFEELAGRYPNFAVVLTNLLAERLGQGTVDGLGEKELGGYRIQRCLGRGGMAVVYEAEELTTGERVALKMMSHRLLYEPDALERFQREARIVSELCHENVARVRGRFSAYNTYFIVMEYLDGRDLGSIVKHHGPLGEDTVRGLLGQLARALEYIHARGVIHRDLKPSNVMVTRRGTVKLMDFGIARPDPAGGETALTSTRMILGTPLFMAPEQIAGEKLDRRADLYAFGCVAYSLLAGAPPFQADDFTALVYRKLTWRLPTKDEIRPGLSEDLFQVLQASLATRPEDRGLALAEVASWARPVDPALVEAVPEGKASPSRDPTRTAPGTDGP